ncbi:hypothetical protein K4L06_15850 [Lysobacter sp. BMK333-48F3]|uniref:hypothetical protein n=1 Tax=Lysobacter sp. BMK333-48F3 TaxID=2867962 RepID=UPI001C8C52D4|nr:hypothetical protein [Lysobacter sp. BMK333-48F3]MBX9402784.1 hypothetical protein [Lysobacter sp. BMK333-48F3]
MNAGAVRGRNRRSSILLLPALLVLSACGADRAERQAAQPAAAGQPIDRVETAQRLNAMRGQAMAGDQAALQQSVSELDRDLRRAVRLVDPERKIDRENARIAAKSVAGVRSAVWVDEENLLAIVDRNAQRSYGTIDAICTRLEPMGDTLGVVVNLQSGAARNGDELEILSRNCELPPGQRAQAQAHRQIDVLPPQVRAQHRANADAALAAQGRGAEREESERIIQASTPEM